MRALLVVAIAAAGLIPRPVLAQFFSCDRVEEVTARAGCRRDEERQQRNVDRLTALERQVRALQAGQARRPATPAAPAR